MSDFHSQEEEILSVTIDNDSLIKAIEEQTKVIDQVNRSTKTLTAQNKELEKANKELASSGKKNSEEYKKNTEQISKNNAQVALNKAEVNELNKSRKGSISALDTEANSMKAIKAQMAKNIQERNNLNLSTEKGRKRFDELNKTIKAQNEALFEGEKAGGTFGRRVGEYERGLSQVNPVLGSFISGIRASTTAALAFVATPIGAVIGALGLALGAVISYFKRTQEGIDTLRVASVTLTTVFNKLMDTVSELGGVIVRAFTDPKQALMDFSQAVKDNVSDRIDALFETFGLLGDAIKKAFKGDFEGALDSATAAGKKYVTEVSLIGSTINSVVESGVEGFKNLKEEITTTATGAANLERQLIALEKAENTLILTRAKANTIVKDQNKIAEDVTKSLEERQAAAEKAIATENKILQEELRIANARATIIQQQNELTVSTEEDRKRELEALAKVEELTTRSLELQTTLTNKLNIIRQQALNQELKTAEEKAKIQEAERIRLEALQEQEFELELFRKERDAQQIEDAQLKAEALIEIERFKLERDLENEALSLEQRTLLNEQYAQREVEINTKATEELNKLEQQKVAMQKKAASDGLGYLASFGAGFKVFAIAKATLDGFLAIQEQLKLPFPANIVASAITGAATVKNIVGVKSTTFRRGGLNKDYSRGGIGQGASHEGGGIQMFSKGGHTGEFEGGEAIINKRSTQMFAPVLSALNVAGGGKPFFKQGGINHFATGGVNSSASAINQNSMVSKSIMKSLQSMKAPVIGLEQFAEAQSNLVNIQQTAQV